MKLKQISRKRFFRILINILMVGFVFAIAKLTRLNERFTGTRSHTIDKNSLKEGFNFFDEFIVWMNSESIKVFSSKCTHLGCRITKAEGQELVCPCHGSHYNKKGEPVQGPAPRALSTPSFEILGDKIIITFASG